MAIETFIIINKMTPVCLHDLVNEKTLNMLSDIAIFWKSHKLELHIMVRRAPILLLLHCGTALRTISELKIVSLNLRVSFSLGMGRNVAVLRVDNFSILGFIKVLLTLI